MEQGDTQTIDSPAGDRYSLPMRVLHWTRAILIFGLIFVGWLMMNVLPETDPMLKVLFPNHKQFGVLTFFIVLIALFVRSRSRVPELPSGLAKWEMTLSHVTHRLLYVLALLVPLMGYSMSSSATPSYGVPFFGVMLPELLPKNNDASAVFEWLHEVLAYTLLAVALLHILGALKHRFVDRNRSNDVLHRML